MRDNSFELSNGSFLFSFRCSRYVTEIPCSICIPRDTKKKTNTLPWKTPSTDTYCCCFASPYILSISRHNVHVCQQHTVRAYIVCEWTTMAVVSQRSRYSQITHWHTVERPCMLCVFRINIMARHTYTHSFTHSHSHTDICSKSLAEWMPPEFFHWTVHIVVDMNYIPIERASSNAHVFYATLVCTLSHTNHAQTHSNERRSTCIRFSIENLLESLSLLHTNTHTHQHSRTLWQLKIDGMKNPQFVYTLDAVHSGLCSNKHSINRTLSHSLCTSVLLIEIDRKKKKTN